MRNARVKLAVLIIGMLLIGFLGGMLLSYQPEPIVVKSPTGYTETVEDINGIRVR